VTRTVLSVAFPFARVTCDPVGGAEQVLAQLDRALVAEGWRSIVVAPEGSVPAGELLATPLPAGTIDAAARRATHAAVRRAIALAVACERIDLVHLHGVDFADYLPPAGPPVLATLHLPLPWYAEAALRPLRPLTWLNPVSRSQAAAAPAGVRLTAPIENGVELARFDRRVRKGGYAVALGRVCPEKGLHLALDAARAADVPLLLAGEVFPYEAHQRYFETEIRPRLDGRRRWLGPVAGRAKARLLAGARCLLAPSLAAETSSLVAREALAAGTPVIAFPSGALAETIEDGRTGFLVEDVQAMAAAIRRAGEIDPEACRAAARARFDAARTTAAYLDLYRSLIAIAEETRGGRRAYG
jgi:glycosyltransferase involved in cell wall biosynthesis